MCTFRCNCYCHVTGRVIFLIKIPQILHHINPTLARPHLQCITVTYTHNQTQNTIKPIYMYMYNWSHDGHVTCTCIVAVPQGKFLSGWSVRAKDENNCWRRLLSLCKESLNSKKYMYMYKKEI